MRALVTVLVLVFGVTLGLAVMSWATLPEAKPATAYAGEFGTPATLLMALAISPLAMALPAFSVTRMRIPVGICFVECVPAKAVRLKAAYDGGIVAPAPVLVGSYGFKVGRGYATAYPAEMIDVHPLRDRTNRFFIGFSMSTPRFSPCTADAVSVGSQTASPEPARIGLLHVAPEPIGALRDKWIAVVLPSAVMHRAPVTANRWLTANRAGVSHGRSMPCIYA